MARIRTIKPEFPQSESIGKLSRDARLLYIQLFTIVDDAGRARAASRMLASLLYPYDDEARELIDGWLLELEQGEHVRRYEVGGSQYLEIVKWLEHQKIDKPSKSRLPEFVEGSRIVAKAREASATDLVPSTCTLDLVPSPSPAKPQACSSDAFKRFKATFPRRDGSNPWLPAEKKFNALVKTGVDPEVMIRAAAELAREEGTRGNIGTKFIPQAITWLNQQRFTDYAAAAALVSDMPAGYYAKQDSEQLEAWDQHSLSSRGKRLPRDRNGGWRVSSEWPPGYVPIVGAAELSAHLRSGFGPGEIGK